MQPQIDNIRSHKQLHKLSAFINNTNNNINNTINNSNNNHHPTIIPSSSISESKHGTLKTIKSLRPINNQKHLTYFSSSSSQQSSKNIALFNKKILNNNNNNNNMFYSLSKDVQRLFELLSLLQEQHHHQQQYQNNNKPIQSHYEQIDSIFTRLNLSFFQSIKSQLTILQYHQLISKCRLVCFAEDKLISLKNNQDKLYYVLVQGQVKVYQQRVMKNNISKQQDQIEYLEMYTAQKGTLLNSQTLNMPKHNPYTIITQSITTLLSFNSHQTYSKLLKKYFIKLSDEHSLSLSNTSLFKGISTLNIKKLLPYFFNKNFYKFNQIIYKQQQKAEYVYWILEGEVQLVKEYWGCQDLVNNYSSNNDNNNSRSINSISNSSPSLNNNINNTNNNNNKKQYKIVKLSKYQIFGIDDYPFQANPKYHFTARVTSQSLKTICISYKSLIQIQNQYPCINENIDFYLKRSTAMHSKIVQKNHRLLQIKDNNFNAKVEKKKKNKRNKKNKKKFPQQMEWWGLAQNNVGSKKYKLQLPKFITLQHSNSTQILPQKSKTLPMFDTTNYRSTKIQKFRRKLFEQDIDDMISAEQRKKSNQQNNKSPYKVNYIPKINKLKIKVLDVKPKMIDQTQKVKKKLLSYAKNIDTFCDKLNLD